MAISNTEKLISGWMGKTRFQLVLQNLMGYLNAKGSEVKQKCLIEEKSSLVFGVLSEWIPERGRWPRSLNYIQAEALFSR